MSTASAPAVGVVMTAYNSEPFIVVALDSLREQSMTDWQCVVVDDGSTDSTTSLVEKIVAGEPRIRLVRQQHGGVSCARNTGLAALDDGVRYVALLDSDDCYLPGALESLVTSLESRPDAVGTFGLAEYIDQDGRPFRRGEHSDQQRSRRAVGPLGMLDVPPEADSTFADMCVIGAIWPSAVGLLRRRVVQAVGGFDPSFTRQEDWELYLRMSRYGPFPVVDRQVAWYRRHSSNLTGNVVENCYQQERVRYKAWRSTSNTPAQRRIVARGARRLQLADIRRASRRLGRNLRVRRSRPAAAEVVSLMLMAATLMRPGPARPNLRRVRWTRRKQDGPPW